MRTLRASVVVCLFAGFISLLSAVPAAHALEAMSGYDALNVVSAANAVTSPDGAHIAYLVRIPRALDADPGSAWSELHVVSVASGVSRPFISGEVNVGSPQWSPDGSSIAFTLRRGDDAKTQVWIIPADGGEAYPATRSKSAVSSFRWHPGGGQIAYIATTPPTAKEKKLDKKGYDFIYVEENVKHRNLYLTDVSRGETEAVQLTDNMTVWEFEFSPDGRTIAAAMTEKNLVDQYYMFKRIYLIDVASKAATKLTDNPGKLGNFAFSPDGKKIAYAAALELADHAVSQAFVIDRAGGASRNLTPDNFRGHISWVGWKNKDTVLYLADEGVWTTLSTVPAGGGARKMILDSRETNINFDAPSYTKDFKQFAFTGTSPEIPRDLFSWAPGKDFKRITTLNPWISERELGREEVVTYQARDGLEIEGILVYPVGYQQGLKYPLIVTVHGGPEAHYSHGWHTGYFQPAQVLAGEGYAVFLPNYRASTGYGVDFAKQGYNDAAGKEFDDIADAIDFLVTMGIADRDRVGLGGGSYGGFAAAWFASFYTNYVRAVAMFVGISDLVSKRGTTDIPFEELYVHSGKKLEEMWQMSLERSPVYYAHQSKTAVLIVGGAADTRVHPSQSLEFFHRLKMNGHPAVRLVQYPGEGHGNRRQPGRADVLFRSLQWYNWYVRDLQPLDGPLPPLDISESYGLKLEE